MEDKMKAEVKMQVRLPVEIRDLLAEDARNNHRSMNGQLIAILAKYFRSIQSGKANKDG
jgi:hypothetical protein